MSEQKTAPAPAAAAAEQLIPPPGPAWFEHPGAIPFEMPAAETVLECFVRQAQAHPDQIVVAESQAGEMTYSQLLRRSLLLSRRLRGFSSPYLGIMLPSSMHTAAAFLAVHFAGKTPVMVNWTTGERLVNLSLGLLGVETVVTSRKLIEKLQSAGVDFPELKKRFVFLEDLYGSVSALDRFLAALKLRLGFDRLARTKVREQAVVLFTSGSENLPKAVPLSHKNLLTNVRDFYSVLNLNHTDRMIGFLPTFHSFGLTVTLLMPLCLALRVVLYSNPKDSKTLSRIIEAYRITMLVGTPTFLSGIARASAGTRRIHSLRITVTGAEKCQETTYRLLAEHSPNAKVLEGYGVTECSPVISVNHEESPAPFTIGKPMASLHVRIVHPETLQKVQPGATGLLLVSGPSVFSGYLKYDGPSPFVELDGMRYYRTGDLVSQAPDGTITFQGRLKRFIKLAGEMISLPAIESVLEPHFVRDGAPGPYIAVEALESDKPEIVLFTTTPRPRNEVNHLLREAGLTPLYSVRYIVAVEAIPVLGNGKTDYRRLKEMLAQNPPKKEA